MELNSLDYIILLIMALSLVSGVLQGLAGAAGGVITTVGSLVLAYLYRNQAADYMEQEYGVITSLSSQIERGVGIPVDHGNTDRLIQTLPLDKAMALLQGQISDFTYLFVSAVCFLLLYMVSRFLFRMIFLALARILERGIGRRANRLGGMALMGAQNLIVMAAVAAVLERPVGLAAQIGLRNGARLQAGLAESVLIPHLLQLWTFVVALVGSSV